MAKKPTEPFRQYIPVPNNRELYELSKALTDRDTFAISAEATEAIAKIEDSRKDIYIQISEYDVMKNPTLLLQATKKKEVIEKVKERIDNLDQNNRDVYQILFTHWMKNKVKDIENNCWRAYIEIDTIHFDYRGLPGKNQESTIHDSQYLNYLNAIDTLANTKVTIDITQETNIAYEKIKNLGWSSIEGVLLERVRYIRGEKRKNTKVIGVWYDLGMFGEAFTLHVPQINNKYPTALLQMDTKSITAKNIGNYLCYLHRCNENTGNYYTLINFYNLMGESGYSIKPPRIQEGINRFLKQLQKIEEILIVNKIISKIEVPIDVQSKNYKDRQVKVYWSYA